jgi:predicted negative regulator of RcsB-dependent stress response
MEKFRSWMKKNWIFVLIFIIIIFVIFAVSGHNKLQADKKKLRHHREMVEVVHENHPHLMAGMNNVRSVPAVV